MRYALCSDAPMTVVVGTQSVANTFNELSKRDRRAYWLFSKS